MNASEFNAGGSPMIALHSMQGGSRNTPSRFMLQKSGYQFRPDGPLGSYADFT